MLRDGSLKTYRTESPRAQQPLPAVRPCADGQVLWANLPIAADAWQIIQPGGLPDAPGAVVPTAVPLQVASPAA